MELTLSPEDAAFRAEARALIADSYPSEMRVPNPEKSRWCCATASCTRRARAHRSGPSNIAARVGRFTHRFICEQAASRAIGVQYHHGLPVHLHVISTLKGTTPRDQDVH